MTFAIETNDQYFKIAASIICKNIIGQKSVCIVDLESFTSIRMLIERIKAYGDKFSFVFISGKGIISSMLEKLAAATKKTTAEDFSKIIRKNNKIPYGSAISYLKSIKHLSMLTRREKNSVYGVLVHSTLSGAASFIGVTPRINYQRTENIARKLNLKSSMHVHYFMNSEFTIDDIRKMIYHV
ncbi:hypothetical protein CF635_003550 [Enterobacter hormaechei]|nr:hypothetical protein [Enterobacter hormaechei]